MSNVIDYREKKLTEIYGENQFSGRILRERLPKSVYKELKKVQNGEMELSLNVAEVVANAMKDWAIEKGATHFTHWFQPLTGLTAEKHDSFISSNGDGEAIMEFSGKELIKGEPDASSFPNGGLRSTFEARGYTAWDTTSPAFLREDNSGTTLYIPTAFVSYTGEALDKKVPLLRSMKEIEKESLRILRALGDEETKRVEVTLGVEQEYFLVEKEFYSERLDLQHTGRTLIGAPSAKDQELTGHYFGTIKERVAHFMKELDHELWKVGISSKTKHHEVAPNQFELAAIFDSVNVATDNNQVVMDLVQKIAVRHDLVALLHEKPFKGVNGSGKHNNWSLATDKGKNLLEPGKTPQRNKEFILFLTAVIEAVDRYAPLLRLAAASSNNDHRLGGHEAPPSIISIFLGEELTDILRKLGDGEEDVKKFLETGVSSLPRLPKDMTDRNRTSPFAFTGNKFEFRMLGSSASTSTTNLCLNTIVAKVLSEYSEKLENASDVEAELSVILKESYRKHKRVIFNGNGYGSEWVEEARKRGLPEFKSTRDVLHIYKEDYIIDLFAKRNILTEKEMESRYVIYCEKYVNQLDLEGRVLLKMLQKKVIPSGESYIGELARDIRAVEKIIGKELVETQKEKLIRCAKAINELTKVGNELEVEVEKTFDDIKEHVDHSRDIIFTLLEKARNISDGLEEMMPKDRWPLPTYEEMLYKL